MTLDETIEYYKNKIISKSSSKYEVQQGTMMVKWLEELKERREKEALHFDLSRNLCLKCESYLTYDPGTSRGKMCPICKEKVDIDQLCEHRNHRDTYSYVVSFATRMWPNAGGTAMGIVLGEKWTEFVKITLKMQHGNFRDDIVKRCGAVICALEGFLQAFSSSTGDAVQAYVNQRHTYPPRP